MCGDFIDFNIFDCIFVDLRTFFLSLQIQQFFMYSGWLSGLGHYAPPPALACTPRLAGLKRPSPFPYKNTCYKICFPLPGESMPEESKPAGQTKTSGLL